MVVGERPGEGEREARGSAIDIDAVLSTATALFAERGFNGVSTREIAKAVGCPLSSLYYHFGNKATLYHEAFVNKLDESIDQIRGEIDDTASPAQQLRQMIGAFFLLFTRDRNLLLLVQRDIVESALPGQGLLCQPQHLYFLTFIGDLVGRYQGRQPDPQTVHLVNGMLLGYCQFDHLVRESQPASAPSEAARLASLQDAILKMLA